MAIRKLVVPSPRSSKSIRLPGFARTIRQSRSKLLRIATAMVGPDDAEDVVQEALLKAWRLTREVPDSWESWLFRCTVNQAKVHLAARHAVPRVLSIDAILEDEAED